MIDQLLGFVIRLVGNGDRSQGSSARTSQNKELEMDGSTFHGIMLCCIIMLAG